MNTPAYQTPKSLRRSPGILNDLPENLQNATHKILNMQSNTVKITERKTELPVSSDRYLQLVQQAEQYMMKHSDRSLSLETLCAALYVSRRTLHNAFHQVVGVGPMSYLKIQRMKRVHYQLEQAHPHTTTVFNTAYEWGFWHMGRFAKDYKQMFGETPSDTLKREPSLPRIDRPAVMNDAG